jgi:hypothetical protein
MCYNFNEQNRALGGFWLLIVAEGVATPFLLLMPHLQLYTDSSDSETNFKNFG